MPGGMRFRGPDEVRPVLEACDVVRFDADGRVASWHAYFDLASMMAQITGAPVG